MGSSGISPSPLPFSLCGVLREVISLSLCLTAETWGISRAPTGGKNCPWVQIKAAAKNCAQNCTYTVGPLGVLFFLKQPHYPACNQDVLLHFISGAGADTSAEWDSGGVSGLETPRAFILVLDGTSALFHAGMNLRFRLALLYLIFCLFTVTSLFSLRYLCMACSLRQMWEIFNTTRLA